MLYEVITIDAVLDGLPPERNYCATLAAQALQAAVKSASASRQPVTASITIDTDDTPRITTEHPLYRLLIDSPVRRGAVPVPQDERPAPALGVVLTSLAGIAPERDPRRHP